MKKVMGLFLGALMGVSLLSCGQGNSSPTEGEQNEEFVQSLDGNKECDIDFVGGYDNFEALEAEAISFNPIPKEPDTPPTIGPSNNPASTQAKLPKCTLGHVGSGTLTNVNSNTTAENIAVSVILSNKSFLFVIIIISLT
jgi:hypothetical protein